MTDSELLLEAIKIVHKARRNHIPPGPFLGGRIWDNTESEVCIDIIDLVKRDRESKLEKKA